ncbi:hypothetical protein [Flavobacterium sp. ABG]|uniref:hypothetical protein n=1 Tax=Flavobacterium sp. ABG TaxID=1423322 RepID=UPI00064A3CF1|nr:hypothetical protein [Flavobacterium sp. ABG]KLT70944.1 hypothetical protein AB674_03895 [Flavobacterium sp. ABG]
MKTKLLFLSIFLLFFLNGYTQVKRFTSDSPGYMKTTYIFTDAPKIVKVDDTGTEITDDENIPLRAPIGARFQVYNEIKNSRNVITHFIIKFLYYNNTKRANSYLTYNVTETTDEKESRKSIKEEQLTPAKATTAEEYKLTEKAAKTLNKEKLDDLPDAYFKVPVSDLEKFAAVYVPQSKYHFAYGTISYLARIRPRTHDIPSKWSTDLSLGLAAGLRYDLTENWAITGLGGVAITRISIDKNSVRNLEITTPIEKPAITPNINAMISYKNFSFGLGAGFDWINRDGTPEASAWVYNKKLFYGISIGINVFTSNSENTVPQDGDQDQNKKG